MKRMISLLIAFVLCLSLVCPALATEFVPSITDKGAPEIVVIDDGEGGKAIAVILDGEAIVVAYLDEDCLLITPISEAETSQDIPEDAREELLEIYQGLVDGTIELPYNKISEELDPENMVIRDLFDISWLCDEHEELMEENPDHTIQISFDLGIDKTTTVYGMINVNGEWLVVPCTNNGDGTITCVLGDVGVLALCVLNESLVPPTQTGDNANITLWVTVMAVSVLALAAVLFLRKKEIA